MGSPSKEHLCKVLVVGDLGVGKTSIIQRYVHKVYSQHYRATIGVDFALKVLKWDQETVVRLQLWDIAGQERFGNMTRLYYREAVGAFIVFDVTRASTFEAVPRWKEDMDAKVSLQSGKPIPIILLANKCDQLPEGLGTDLPRLDHFCRDNGFSGWFETSAKENLNIEEAVGCLIKNMIANEEGTDSRRDPNIALNTVKTKSQHCSDCGKF
ncbi:ras-related protein Rab-38-like [Ambystoma mexicanum]|uniref:ras-related protein Rab-38-like n=1 Tax=Ambystoma mexicanum TaxID=8296 RepID=UPI0037E97815